MRDRSAFVLCIPVRSIRRRSTHTLRTSIGTKALPSLVRDEFYWVASGAASATLRALPRYLPWQGATPRIHLRLTQRASRDLISASLSLRQEQATRWSPELSRDRSDPSSNSRYDGCFQLTMTPNRSPGPASSSAARQRAVPPFSPPWGSVCRVGRNQTIPVISTRRIDK